MITIITIYYYNHHQPTIILGCGKTCSMFVSKLRCASICKNCHRTTRNSCNFTEILLFFQQVDFIFALRLRRQVPEAETAKHREECRAGALEKQNQNAQNSMAKQDTYAPKHGAEYLMTTKRNKMY